MPQFWHFLTLKYLLRVTGDSVKVSPALVSTTFAADEALLLVAALVLAFTIALLLFVRLLTRLLIILLVGLGLRQLTDRGPADGTLELLFFRGLLLPCDDAGGVEDVAALQLDGLAVVFEATGADDARLLE